MSADQQSVLFANTARAIGAAPREIQVRHIGNCMKADPAYGKGVAKALGIPFRLMPAAPGRCSYEILTTMSCNTSPARARRSAALDKWR